MCNRQEEIVMQEPYQQQQMVSEKSKGTAAVLCFFFGWLGIHRFYVGKTGTGLLWMFTLGLAGLGEIIDFIMILCGSFTDKNGAALR
jgi:TM2 domain-containing membrane protein YozV